MVGFHSMLLLLIEITIFQSILVATVIVLAALNQGVYEAERLMSRWEVSNLKPPSESIIVSKVNA